MDVLNRYGYLAMSIDSYADTSRLLEKCRIVLRATKPIPDPDEVDHLILDTIRHIQK